MRTETVKLPAQVKAEMNAYRKYWRSRPDDYVRYGLFRENLSMDQILDYVPMRYYYTEFYKSIFGTVNNLDLDASDKLVQYRKFHERGIAVPEVIMTVKSGRLFHPLTGTEFTYDEFLQLVHDGERLFVKPIDGCSGIGISVMDKQNGKLVHNGKPVNSLEDMNLDSALDYIIQRQLIQRDDLATVNPSSLNTLRTIVRYDNGEPVILAVILRIGRAGSFVDNSHMGGVSVAVDLMTGRFGQNARREHGGGNFDRHPDTGYVFAEGGIRDWLEVKASILDIIKRVTEYPLLGWDIAIGVDGVYALEYNMGFGIEHAQTVMGGFRRRLGIDMSD